MIPMPVRTRSVASGASPGTEALLVLDDSRAVTFLVVELRA
jgi:hypothetical protein